MDSHIILVFLFIGILYFECISSAEECLGKDFYSNGLRLNIFSARNKTGKWVTKFSAYKDDPELDEDNYIAVDILQDLTLCHGRRTLIIRGQIVDKDPFREDAMEEIRFHPKCGINAVIINDGHTVKKKILSETGHGIAFTNRPLKNNELFEVVLEEKINNFKNSLAIGVSPYPPTNVTIKKFITELRPPSWSMYYADLYHDANVVKKNYGRSLDTVVVGDRVGIMRRDNGNLHYFINGADQGVAASSIPDPVYGLIELYANAAMATIVKGS